MKVSRQINPVYTLVLNQLEMEQLYALVNIIKSPDENEGICSRKSFEAISLAVGLNSDGEGVCEDFDTDAWDLVYNLTKGHHLVNIKVEKED